MNDDNETKVRQRIIALLEENAFAQDRAKRMNTVQLEELFRRRTERRNLLALLKAAGGDPARYEIREEALA